MRGQNQGERSLLEERLNAIEARVSEGVRNRADLSRRLAETTIAAEEAGVQNHRLRTRVRVSTKKSVAKYPYDRGICNQARASTFHFSKSDFIPSFRHELSAVTKEAATDRRVGNIWSMTFS